MDNILAFPKDRIVRPLRKRVARPRAKATEPLHRWEIETRRFAVMMIDRGLSAGQTLEQIHDRLRAEPFNSDDKLLQYTTMAMLEEVTTRMGLAATIWMRDRRPDKAREARLDRMAELLAQRAKRKGKSQAVLDTVLQGIKA